MVIVRFFSYFNNMMGKKELIIPDKYRKVDDIIKYLSTLNDELAEILNDNSPEVNIIVDGQSILLPEGKSKLVEEELIITPIIAGG